MLQNQEILNMAPSIGALHPHEEVSDKYTFIPTIEVVNILRKEGWIPTRVTEAGFRKPDNEGFQKHMIRFQHPDLILRNEAIEAVLINSHNRSCAYKLMTGVYRFICMNGMILGDTFDSISIKHINFDKQDVIEASYKVLETAPVVAGSIEEMKATQLQESEREAYAKSALHLVYDDPEEAPIDTRQLLSPRRARDCEPDLWTTFNTVQENIIKGGLRGRNKKTGKKIKTRPVKAIDRNVKLNRALWTLTEKMKELKTEIKSCLPTKEKLN